MKTMNRARITKTPSEVDLEKSKSLKILEFSDIIMAPMIAKLHLSRVARTVAMKRGSLK